MIHIIQEAASRMEKIFTSYISDGGLVPNEQTPKTKQTTTPLKEKN